MNIVFREGTSADAAACGPIIFEAFKEISSAHGFPWDFPSAEVGVGVATMLLGHPGFWGVVAESGGKILGSNFLDERNPIAGIGPITVDPTVQNQTIGRQLMVEVIERAAAKGFAGVRLVQAAYHNRSLCLYTKLGFETREPLSKMNGDPPKVRLEGYAVRSARTDDAAKCNPLCLRVHGHHRAGEVGDAIGQGTAKVVERAGRITGYSTDIGFFAHAVGETNEDICALIGAADAFQGGGFLLPTRNGELFRWCLAHGLKLVHQMTLMTTGLYSEPAGAWLPSVLY
jgi:GNAT superfamily N-acetyltransferase